MNNETMNNEQEGNSLVKVRNWAQGRTGRFLLTQLAHTVMTVVVLAALLLGAARVGALNGVLAPAAATTDASFTTINYQGRLADSGGAPISGTITLQFSLYDSDTGSSLLWGPETHANVPVSDGLFSVRLGSQTTGGMPINVFSGGDVWLETIVEGETLSPREKLTAVPYAMMAGTVPDGSIATEKIAEGAVTGLKQTITTYSAQDNSYVTLDGATNVTVSEFQFDNVPAGDVSVIVTFVGSHPEGASNRGSVRLEAASGGQLDRIPTHVFTTHYGQFALHGRIQDFAGGTLTLQVVAGGETSGTQLRFGTSNGDGRFGRRITVIAGL